MCFSQDRVICINKNRATHFGLSSPNDVFLINMLRDLAIKGLDYRLHSHLKYIDIGKYEARLRSELSDIIDIGFASHFIVAHEVVDWARKQSIAVGAGYGSFSGSLVAWALGITSIDPLSYGLLFERFLNKMRKSQPVINILFSFLRFSEIVNHMSEIYGVDAISVLTQSEIFINDCIAIYTFPCPHLDIVSKLLQKYEKLAFDDQETWEFLAQGATNDIYLAQMPEFCDSLKKVQPSNLEDLSVLLALYRPLPIAHGVLETFIRNAKSKVAFEGLHDCVQASLQQTRGVLVYQEQIMAIAHEMASYTMCEADLLWRELARKKSVEVARHREIFIYRAIKNGIPLSTAQETYAMLENGAQYCFNHSHSLVEAMLLYQTAWCKVHKREAYDAEYGKIF